jgi:ligand-binding SRPBCC domain-containing protein
MSPVMDVSGYHHSDSITVNAPPDAVYAIVSDVTRIGELSPVCKAGAWDDPGQAGKQGAWFTGRNAIGEFEWVTHCKVATAEPGREFSFVNHGPSGEVELVYWGYALEPEGEATKVTETWQVLPAYPDMVLSDNPDADVAARIDGMAQLARDGIRDTLANLKRVAES